MSNDTTEHSVICGIDPGISGALAFIDKDTGELLAVIDMPTVESKLADGRKRRRVDALKLFGILYAFKPTLVLLEEVNSYGMGRQSAFNFGHSYAIAQATAQLVGAPIIDLPPNKWKPRMGFKPGADKNASRSLATAIHGSDAHWSRKMDDGRAEAFLMALYGYRVLSGLIKAEA